MGGSEQVAGLVLGAGRGVGGKEHGLRLDMAACREDKLKECTVRPCRGGRAILEQIERERSDW